jgi:hypothetical protein
MDKRKVPTYTLKWQEMGTDDIPRSIEMMRDRSKAFEGRDELTEAAVHKAAVSTASTS